MAAALSARAGHLCSHAAPCMSAMQTMLCADIDTAAQLTADLIMQLAELLPDSVWDDVATSSQELANLQPQTGTFSVLHV